MASNLKDASYNTRASDRNDGELSFLWQTQAAVLTTAALLMVACVKSNPGI